MLVLIKRSVILGVSDLANSKMELTLQSNSLFLCSLKLFALILPYAIRLYFARLAVMISLLSIVCI
jgi:hypothetical protein